MTWQDEDRPSRAVAPDAGVIEVRINPDRALPLILGVVVLLSCLSFSGQLLQHALHPGVAGPAWWISAFGVEQQHGVPAWFRSVTLLVDALALWTVADDAKARADGWARHWRLLAVAFAALCLDELMGIHHQVVAAIQASLHVSDLFFFAWVLPAIALVAVLGLMYGRFLWAMPRRTSVGLIGGAATYLGGAVCLAMLRSSTGPDTVLQAGVTTVGAALQMFALVALTITIGRYDGTVRAASVDWTVTRTVPADHPQVTRVGEVTEVIGVTEVIDVTERPQIAPVVLDDVTARPVEPAPGGGPADTWYVSPQQAATAELPSDPAHRASDESPNRMFERPTHATHRSR